MLRVSPQDKIWQAEGELAAIGAALTPAIKLAATARNDGILRFLVWLKSEINGHRGQLRRLACEQNREADAAVRLAGQPLSDLLRLKRIPSQASDRQ